MGFALVFVCVMGCGATDISDEKELYSRVSRLREIDDFKKFKKLYAPESLRALEKYDAIWSDGFVRSQFNAPEGKFLGVKYVSVSREDLNPRARFPVIPTVRIEEKYKDGIFTSTQYLFATQINNNWYLVTYIPKFIKPTNPEKGNGN